MGSGIRPITCLVLILGLASAAHADKPAGEKDKAPTTRIGAVAYSPAAVTIFQGLMA